MLALLVTPCLKQLLSAIVRRKFSQAIPQEVPSKTLNHPLRTNMVRIYIDTIEYDNFSIDK